MSAVDALMARPVWTSVDVCRRARVTYRQLDYMVRTGILSPAGAVCGSGTQRRYTDLDLLGVAVAGHLRARGARTHICQRAVEAVNEIGDPLATGVLVVDLAGAASFLASPETLTPAEILRLLAVGWVVPLPPPTLDIDTLAG